LGNRRQGNPNTASVKRRKEVDTLKNINMDVSDNVLTVTIDLSQDQGPSKSGKTVVIASREGNVDVTGHSLPYAIKLGVNCHHYPD
jgi:hypothetical protein